MEIAYVVRGNGAIYVADAAGNNVEITVITARNGVPMRVASVEVDYDEFVDALIELLGEFRWALTTHRVVDCSYYGDYCSRIAVPNTERIRKLVELARRALEQTPGRVIEAEGGIKVWSEEEEAVAKKVAEKLQEAIELLEKLERG